MTKDLVYFSGVLKMFLLDKGYIDENSPTYYVLEEIKDGYHKLIQRCYKIKNLNQNINIYICVDNIKRNNKVRISAIEEKDNKKEILFEVPMNYDWRKELSGRLDEILNSQR